MIAVTTQAFSAIEAAAQRAGSNTESSVQFLTDTLFERLLRTIPPKHSLRSRVTRTELAFRVGSHPTITEKQLTEEANKAIAREGLPDSVKASQPLLHEYRTGLQPHVPHLIGIVSTTDNLTQEMSPAESVFLILYIGADLLGRYRGNESPLAKGPEPEFARGQRATFMLFRWDDSYKREFAREVSREDSHTSQALHGFLDALGFER